MGFEEPRESVCLFDLKEIDMCVLLALFGYLLKRRKVLVVSEEPIKDQLLYADASPTPLSPGYIADSDPEEDEEDPEEDPADYPTDGGDNDDNESYDDDDDDDDVEKDEEEEHLATAGPSVVPIDDHVPLS
nr:hypothetical protein [Tanacetum cinerariifolium]